MENLGLVRKDWTEFDQLTWILFTFSYNMLVRVQARTRVMRSCSTLRSV